jgi:hypothetical protein
LLRYLYGPIRYSHARSTESATSHPATVTPWWICLVISARIITRKSFSYYLSRNTTSMTLDDNSLEPTLYHPKHLLTLAHLNAKFTVLAYLTLDLGLFLGDALLVGFLAASQNLYYLHVLWQNWHLDEIWWRSALSLGLVVADQINLLRTCTSTSVSLLLLDLLTNADSAAALAPLPLFPVRD